MPEKTHFILLNRFADQQKSLLEFKKIFNQLEYLFYSTKL